MVRHPGDCPRRSGRRRYAHRHRPAGGLSPGEKSGDACRARPARRGAVPAGRGASPQSDPRRRRAGRRIGRRGLHPHPAPLALLARHRRRTPGCRGGFARRRLPLLHLQLPHALHRHRHRACSLCSRAASGSADSDSEAAGIGVHCRGLCRPSTSPRCFARSR